MSIQFNEGVEEVLAMIEKAPGSADPRLHAAFRVIKYYGQVIDVLMNALDDQMGISHKARMQVEGIAKDWEKGLKK